MGKKTILIADDDLGILDALTLLLEDAGYEVTTVSDGATIREVHTAPPDLLLLDIWLSGWNGRDICIALKSAEQTKHMPILLFSANKDTGKIAQEAGADDFIAKPFDMDELLEKIEKYLS
ncbi:MAG: response regulator transcription factor [Ktedonobacteraceae bacterium]|nr:response regulator transcription factor [Ktedonobacteraceae bacterium]